MAIKCNNIPKFKLPSNKFTFFFCGRGKPRSNNIPKFKLPLNKFAFFFLAEVWTPNLAYIMHCLYQLVFFWRNQNGIKTPRVMHLTQGVQKRITQSSYKVNVRCQKQTKKLHTLKKKELLRNTHTYQRVPPPVSITESEGKHFSFQPSKRHKLNAIQ